MSGRMYCTVVMMERKTTPQAQASVMMKRKTPPQAQASVMLTTKRY